MCHCAAAQGVVERVAATDAEGKAKDGAEQWHIKATGAIVY